MIILKHLARALLLLAGIWTLNFCLIRLSPGDATNVYWGPDRDRASIETLRAQRGLELPFWQQFEIWTRRFARGDWGYSWMRHRPVIDILKEAVPNTLQLTVLALAFCFFFGAAWGVLAARYDDRLAGHALNFSGLIIYALPSFWLAALAILFFGVKLQWLPSSGMSALFIEEASRAAQLWDRVRHLILPVTVLGLSGAAAVSRFVRASVRNVLRQDFIRLAQAKGLSQREVLLRHALKNALLPVVTLLGLYFPFLLGGALAVEVMFAWPGMGRIAYEALFSKDYPVLFAVNLITAAMTIAGNLLADLLYHFLDPRVRRA
jgi:peptide/nickel transport system permease protein